jgi:hypothetical protein
MHKLCIVTSFQKIQNEKDEEEKGKNKFTVEKQPLAQADDQGQHQQ